MSDAPVSTLYLLRHAHSSWALPGQRDHQRPLDARGTGDAPRIGAEIARRGYRIDRVLCSTAVRAERTLAAIREHLSADVEIEFSDSLYGLGVDAYLAAVKGHASAASLMIVGHNPMIEELTISLAGTGERAALDQLRAGFPTAGLAVIDFPVPLPAVAAGGGRLRRLVHPRDLAD